MEIELTQEDRARVLRVIQELGLVVAYNALMTAHPRDVLGRSCLPEAQCCTVEELRATVHKIDVMTDAVTVKHRIEVAGLAYALRF